MIALIIWWGMTVLAWSACGSSSSTSPTTTTTTAPAAAAAVTLSAYTLAFPINATAGTAETVTLTNSGSSTLTMTSIAPSSNFLEADDCGTSVEVGAACTITVTFNPVAPGSGGTLIITDNAPTSPQTVTLTGPNVQPPGALVTPSTLTFASQALGTTSPPQAVTLTNPINGVSIPLMISSSSITGDDFAIVQNGCQGSIPPGASCTDSVTFTPTAPGSRVGALAIFDNATSHLQTVVLLGSGQ